MWADLALVTVQAHFAPVANALVHVKLHKLTGNCLNDKLFGQVSKTADSVKLLVTPWC